MTLVKFTLDAGDRIAVNPKYVAAVALANAGIDDNGQFVNSETVLFLHCPTQEGEIHHGILGLREPFDEVVAALRDAP